MSYLKHNEKMHSGITPNSQLNQCQIAISNLSYKVSIIGEKSIVKMSMDIHNGTDRVVEYDHILPFIYPHVPKSFDVCYKNQSKKCFHSNDFPIVEFDDDVSSGNFTIRLYQQKENETHLNISNFNPNDRISMLIELSSNLIETRNSSIFKIPLIEKCIKHSYPNYSITIQDCKKDIRNQTVKIQYNDKRTCKYIMNHFGIEIKEVSLEKEFKLIIPRQRSHEQTCKSIKGTKDIILFIDNETCLEKYISSCILKFLKNYGKNFRFNIVRIGPNSDIFSTKMSKNNKDNLNKAEMFLNKPQITKENYGLERAYSNIFNNIEYKEETISESESIQQIEKEREEQKIQSKLIEDVDRLNTVAIFVGSFSEDLIIIHTVPTYLIETAKRHNSCSFACKNRIFNIDTSEGFEESFENLIQYLRTDTQSKTEEDVNESQQYEIMIQNEINKFNDFLSQDQKQIKIIIEQLYKSIKSNTKHPLLNKLSKKTLQLIHEISQKSKQFNVDQINLDHNSFFKELNHYYINGLQKNIFKEDFLNEILNTNKHMQEKMNQYADEVNKSNKGFTEMQFLLLKLLLHSKYQTIIDYIQSAMINKQIKLEENSADQNPNMFFDPFTKCPYATFKNCTASNDNRDFITSFSLPSKPITEFHSQPIPLSQIESKSKMQNQSCSYGIDSTISHKKTSEYKIRMIKERSSIFDQKPESISKMHDAIEQMKLCQLEIKGNMESKNSSDDKEEEDDEEESYIQFASSINLISNDMSFVEVPVFVQIPDPSKFVKKEKARFVISSKLHDRVNDDMSQVEAIEIPRIEILEKFEPVGRETKNIMKNKAYFEFSNKVSNSNSTFIISAPREVELVYEKNKTRRVEIRIQNEPDFDIEPELDLSHAESIFN